jgi:hypothetical protein
MLEYRDELLAEQISLFAKQVEGHTAEEECALGAISTAKNALAAATKAETQARSKAAFAAQAVGAATGRKRDAAAQVRVTRAVTDPGETRRGLRSVLVSG